jgi:hypothetical protein|tara:strand:- start:1185 stop:1502 length:318 start_codon:yes stop_codon:yes gene_type:complete
METEVVEVVANTDPTLVTLLNEYGFPIVMMVGLGYFIYYIWWFVGEKLEPEIEKQHFALIKVIDQVRMLDQDLIRLQQKVDVVLEYKENAKKKEVKNAENSSDNN